MLNLISERLQVHVQGRDRDLAAESRADRRASSKRHRHRHPRGRDPPFVRTVPPGRELARPHPRGQRHRAGSGARVAQAARRCRFRRERSRCGHDVHHHHAAGIGASTLSPDRNQAHQGRPAPPPPVPLSKKCCGWVPDSSESGDHGEAARIDAGPLVPERASHIEKDAERPYVLVADDNADMRQYVVRLLAERYRVRAVPDGEAVLAAVRESTPDLVLTDVMMPRLDGFGLLTALRADPATCSVPVIMLSAPAGEESRIDGMEAGADDYLVKPFAARELLARVGALANRAVPARGRSPQGRIHRHTRA